MDLDKKQILMIFESLLTFFEAAVVYEAAGTVVKMDLGLKPIL